MTRGHKRPILQENALSIRLHQRSDDGGQLRAQRTSSIIEEQV
jgi:hypothetical protein